MADVISYSQAYKTKCMLNVLRGSGYKAEGVANIMGSLQSPNMRIIVFADLQGSI